MRTVDFLASLVALYYILGSVCGNGAGQWRSHAPWPCSFVTISILFHAIFTSMQVEGGPSGRGANVYWILVARLPWWSKT
jgi:hypothetical protein